MIDEFQTYVHTIGDSLYPAAFTLERDGVAVNLTGKSVSVAIFDEDGNAVVDWTTTGISITSAIDGQVEYTFNGTLPATEGDYWLFIRVYATGTPDVYSVFPPGRKFKIQAIQVG